MSDDLVKRARDRETRREFDDWGILDELADRIEALTAERDALKAELAEALIHVADLYRLHIRSGPKWDHDPTKRVMDDTRAFLARDQKETGV